MQLLEVQGGDVPLLVVVVEVAEGVGVVAAPEEAPSLPGGVEATGLGPDAPTGDEAVGPVVVEDVGDGGVVGGLVAGQALAEVGEGRDQGTR